MDRALLFSLFRGMNWVRLWRGSWCFSSKLAFNWCL